MDQNGKVLVHYDKRGPKHNFEQLVRRYYDSGRCQVITGQGRVKCAWGTFGLVRSVLNAFEYLRQNRVDYSHFYLLSGSCFPIKPLTELRDFLQVNAATEFIECQDENWIRGGIKKDRYLYHYLVSKREHPKLFRWSYLVQKKLRLRRQLVKNLTIKFGSQWWCLSRDTVSKIVSFAECNASINSFFRTVWIPDECFFQTLVFHLCEEKNIANRSLTYYEFMTDGRPRSFQNSDVTDGIRNKYFFIRKYY